MNKILLAVFSLAAFTLIELGDGCEIVSEYGAYPNLQDQQEHCSKKEFYACAKQGMAY